MKRLLFMMCMIAVFAGAARGSDAPFQVEWAVKAADSRRITLEGRIAGPVTLPANARISCAASHGSAVCDAGLGRETLSVDLHSESDESLLAVVVRVDAESFVWVDELRFGIRGASFARLTTREFADRQAASRDEALRPEIEARARELAADAKGRGKRPVRVTGDEGDSPFLDAWLKAAPAPPSVDPVCGAFRPTDNNAEYSVSGTVFYESWVSPVGKQPLQASGYSVKLETIIEMENLCQEIIYRPRVQFASTTAGGTFEFPSVMTAEPAGYWDPANRFSVTTNDVGEWAGGLSMSPVIHTLNAPDHDFRWSGQGAILAPYFKSTNSTYRFMFRWNDELASLRDYWCGTGLCQFVNFRAAYWEGNDYAHFESSAPPGLVMFSSAQWVRAYVMAHEFGHAFNYQLQGQVAFPATGEQHRCTSASETTSVVEGFADWFAAFPTDGYFVDPEIVCSGGECHPCDGGGWTFKTNVAGFFWDLFDSTNHPTSDRYLDQNIDTVQYPLSLLASWRSGSCYISFEDFYQDFAMRNLWTIGGTDGLRGLNHVTNP